MDLFRVMPFSRLKQIAENSALAFVSYRKFPDDPHEALLLRALTTSDGVKDVYKLLKSRGDHYALPSLILSARCADTTVFMQCWTRQPEHNLMWERYAQETTADNVTTNKNAIRVRMNEEGRKNLPYFVIDAPVRYEPFFDLARELDLVSHDQILDFQQSLTFKLDAYRHEDEVRLMVPVYNDMDNVTKDGEVVSPWWKNPRGDKDVTLVPIRSISSVISSVMTGPLADDQLQRDVEEFCKSNGLSYEGKSTLRTPKYTGTRKIFTTDKD